MFQQSPHSTPQQKTTLPTQLKYQKSFFLKFNKTGKILTYIYFFKNQPPLPKRPTQHQWFQQQKLSEEVKGNVEKEELIIEVN